MATKEQEREALKEIARIIKELGAGSYLEMTFAGVLEQAEDNIKNDFASNYKELYEIQCEKVVELQRELRDEHETTRDLKEQMKTITGVLKAAQDKNEEYKHRIDDIKTEKNQTTSDLMNSQIETNALKAEIITLKAKLYDLMTQ